MKSLGRHFFQGLLVFVPLVATVYTVYLVLRSLDGWLATPIPGLGLLLILVVITLVGFLAGRVAGQRVITWLEKGMRRLPVVYLLYSSIKDLLGAFVGDRRSFEKPVMVTLDDAGELRVFGFVTCDSFDDPRLAGYAAVYLPQAYNFAGNLVVVEQKRIEAVDADSAQFLAFVVSGGVAEMNAARTAFDPDLNLALPKA